MCNGKKTIKIQTSYKWGEVDNSIKEISCFGCNGTGTKTNPSNINSAMRYIG